MRKIEKIIIHCTATPEGRHHTAADIRKWHLARGFTNIGYHYIVQLDGTIEPGRAEAMPGAHTLGHNADSIGVCYVGGLNQLMKPKDTRTPDQKASLLHLIKILKQRYPDVKIFGHRDFEKNKECPCFDPKLEYSNL